MKYPLLLLSLIVAIPMASAKNTPTIPDLEPGSTMRYTGWQKARHLLIRSVEWRQGDTVELCFQVSPYTYGNYSPSTVYSIGECRHVYQQLPDGSVDPVIALPVSTMGKLKRHSLETLENDGEISDGLPGKDIVLPEAAQQVSRHTRLGQ